MDYRQFDPQGQGQGASGHATQPHPGQALGPPAVPWPPSQPLQEHELVPMGTRLVPHSLALALAMSGTGGDPAAAYQGSHSPAAGPHFGPPGGPGSAIATTALQKALQGWWAEGYQAAMQQSARPSL